MANEPTTSFRVSLLRALLALWLPAVLPLLFGPLTECGHCVRSYLFSLPILPGVLPAALLVQRLESDGFAFAGLALLVTVAIVLLVAALLRLCGRRWPWPALLCVVLAGANALCFGAALRM